MFLYNMFITWNHVAPLLPWATTLTHAKIIAKFNAEDIPKIVEQFLNSEVQRYWDVMDYKSFTYIHYKQLEPTSFINALYTVG